MNISDPIYTLNHLFTGLPEPSLCLKALDVNDDGGLNITDGNFALAFLFLGGPAPPAPGHEACGIDATPDRLACEAQPRC